MSQSHRIPPELVTPLLKEAGLPTSFELVALKGGGNNRVYRVDCEGKPGAAALKAYFRHPQDPRDRLGAEFSFCCFAWDNDLCWTPRPIVWDRVNNLGLYEFIDGHRLSPTDIRQEHVDAALGFYRQINEHRSTPYGKSLPTASEACFSMAEHLATVQRRLDRLDQIDTGTPAGKNASDLVTRAMYPLFLETQASILASASQDQSRPEVDRRISPSDFGFHNALLSVHGLRFIDFEYAGWDDPAKMVCDFFSQPAVPVPIEFYEDFAAAVAEDLTEPERQIERFGLLLPLYRLKWCCIMLNEFLPVGDSRRSFAREGEDQEQRRAAQLAKVREALTHINP